MGWFARQEIILQFCISIVGIVLLGSLIASTSHNLLAFKSSTIPSVQNSNSSLTSGSTLQTNSTDNIVVAPIQSNSNVSTSISMNLDKKFYTVGEIVGIRGSVKNLIEGNNEIRTDLHDSEGKVLSSKDLVQLDGRNFSFNKHTSGTNPGDYVVLATYGDQTGTITYKVTAPNPELVHSYNTTSGISMNLDKKFYTVGEIVGIRGSVKNSIEGNNEIRTDLHDSEGKVLSSKDLVQLDGRNFSFNKHTSGTNPGDYVVLATYGDQTGTITYKVTAPTN